MLWVLMHVVCFVFFFFLYWMFLGHHLAGEKNNQGTLCEAVHDAKLNSVPG